MKKLIFILPMIVMGCTTETRTDVAEGACTTISQVEIFQALDDGALAHECYFDWDKLSTECNAMYSQTVYLLNHDGLEYFDGMKVKINSSQCFMRNGVYKYESNGRGFRTVPTLKIINK